MNENFSMRLCNLQLSLKAPKNQFNKFGKYNYRSCEDILEGLKPLLSEQKMLLTISDSITQIGDRYYVCATATLRDVESGETVSNTAYAREAEHKTGMDESQITGTASSYARKYALNGLFCIDDTKDTDTDEYAERTGKNAKNQEQKSGSIAQKIFCADCKKELVETKKRDGAYWTAENIANYSKLRFGRILCPECQRKADAEIKGQAQ